MSARVEWDALSPVHRVEAMKEIDDAAMRCDQRAHDHEKRGDAARVEVAERIATHLRRFEASPPANGEPSMFLRPAVRVNGRCVDVFYQWSCRQSTLSRATALAYLTWLDEGGVGRHWEWLTEATKSKGESK